MAQFMLRTRGRAAVIAAVILIGSTALAQFAARPPSPLAAAERLFEAAAFRALGPRRPPDPRVVIAAITEGTLARLAYRSPVDRGFLASLIVQLAGDDVAAIGLDVLLDRPTEAEKDASLRQTLLNASVPVVAISLSPDTPEPDEQRRFLTQFTAGLRIGDANFARERFDDVVRQHVPRHPATGMSSFAASLADAVGVPPPVQPFMIEWRRSVLGAPAVPVYPAEAIPLLPREWLRGRIVLIGSMIPAATSIARRHPASGLLLRRGDPRPGAVADADERRAEPLPVWPWREWLASAVAGGCRHGRSRAAGRLVCSAGDGGGRGARFLVGDLAAYAATGAVVAAGRSRARAARWRAAGCAPGEGMRSGATGGRCGRCSPASSARLSWTRSCGSAICSWPAAGRARRN